ncbi:hypothetical protein [Kribbella shirazensis]|uniref:Uncharacterized protein n=1 Tax=Kribbella shirazensis TaxID=1105143 RepID=A0A7X5VBN2_9ACTN|nr:hypothetical protein [Kribbella shirazensis]NIK58224.1 hypothetical protein [Kribbella shirazensis]
MALVVGVVWLVDWFRGRLPGESYDLDPACAGKVYDDAAPYTGAAPHPVVAFSENEAGVLDFEWPLITERPVTDDVQLVACARLASEEPSGPTCGYHAPAMQVPIVVATYQVTVYELRTGRAMRTFTLQGKDTECPSFLYEGFDEGRLVSRLTDEQWRKALAPLVDENR